MVRYFGGSCRHLFRKNIRRGDENASAMESGAVSWKEGDGILPACKKKNTKDIKTYGADQGGWGERQHVGYVGVQPEAISGLL